MPRRYYRRRPINKDKYSVESTAVVTPALNDWIAVPAHDASQASVQYNTTVVPETAIEGMRKVKHLTLTIANNANTLEYVPLIYAIVYVPAGYEANPINYPSVGTATNLYDPNQYVMQCGVVDFSAGPCRIRSALSRNLNSGDSIRIILASTSTGTSAYTLNVKYAITLQ